jgi:2-keto-3-deoxy-L-rhamnonate aldolase RhmA
VTAISEFRSRLQRGEVLLGPSVVFSDPRVTEALAPSVDFIWLELEHALIGPDAVVAHVMAARAGGVPLIMRIATGMTSLVKPALDSGVEGLVIPQIRTVDEVRAVVDDCRYLPVGRRGLGPVRPSNYGRVAPVDVVAAENMFLAVQIETIEALAVVEEIAKTPGIDSLVIGPTDLSAALGVLSQMDHPLMREAITRIVAAARANGLSVGVGVGDAKTARLMIDQGVQWVQLSGTDAYLWQRFEQLREAVNEG